MLRVLIIAAYASARAGLHSLLADAPEVEIVGAVSGSAEAAAILREARVDAAIAEDAPDDRAALREALTAAETGLVLLGEAQDYPAFVPPATPGWAYLLRAAEAPEILAAARAVAAGLVALDRTLAASTPGGGHIRAARGQDLPGDPLTPREQETLQLMAQGLLNKQIAARLRISPHTVKFHVASILAKLGAASRTEAVTAGLRRGEVLL